GLAFTNHERFRAELVARRLELSLDVAARRVQIRRELIFHKRLIELADVGEAASAKQVVLRGAELRAHETLTRAGIVRMLTKGFRVLNDSEVIVLALLGVVSRANGAR